ncbi:accessory gland protein Acp29AB-like [Drosophila ficusphila]|uniref:accessory gland protein Acp29AB-like n=1 Tax=Drosophila ficusphila TaxID=30025 RepID=UPI001C8A09AB|nr:accessory gland protein Acp29AB-like [Drosophila ficusphila]
MWRYSYFLWLFTVCGLWGTQAQNQEPSLLDQIANHQQQWFRYTAANQAEANAKIDRLKESIEGQLQAQQVKTEIQQHSLRNVMESLKAEIKPKIEKMIKDIEDLKNAIVDQKSFNSSLQRVPPSNLFENIGSRYFYIEKHDTVTWFVAFNKCRRFGGYLATINDEEELQAITKRTTEDSYWFDFNSLAEKGKFFSTRTGERPPFTKWRENYSHTTDDGCVVAFKLEMYAIDCRLKHFFICQSDQ